MSLTTLKWINSIVCTLGAALACYLAHQWQHVGFGLNPAVAIPLAILLIVAMAYVNNAEDAA